VAALPRYYRPRAFLRSPKRRPPPRPGIAPCSHFFDARAKVGRHVVSRAPIDERGLGPAHRMRGVIQRVGTNVPDPLRLVAHTAASSKADQGRSALGRGIGTTSNRFLGGKSSTACLVTSVNSKRTGRPVFPLSDGGPIDCVAVGDPYHRR